MKLLKEEFDSSILKKDVYRVVLDSPLEKIELGEQLAKIKNGIFYCTIPVEFEYIRMLESFDFRLVSIRNTYIHNGKAPPSLTPLSKEYSIQEFRSDMHIAKKDIERLATTIGEVNRYYKDREIPRISSKEIYIQWITNSLYHGLALKVFLVMHKIQAIGICTTRLKDQDAQIDLFGILPEFQRQGIGKHLLITAVNFLFSYNPKTLRVATAGENIKANVFFQQNNFVINTVKLVYHKHV